jgi:putative Holliday junction resolvase
MGRILAIDYGLARTGLSVTDPDQIIVQPLTALDTKQLWTFLESYIQKENVTLILVGYPFMEGTWGDPGFKKSLDALIVRLRNAYPKIPVAMHDERNTSQRAREIMVQRGLKKKHREDKKILDQTSAVVILQEYLGHI